MKVLIIKTSSMGDVIHTLPALTDAKKALPHALFDWVVEESFVDIVNAHPAVNRVLPIAIRRWRKNPLRYLFHPNEIKKAIRSIRQTHYDVIIDAQGLLKSAIITAIAKGKAKHGLDKTSSRGKVAWFYTNKHTIAYQQHAIDRVRQLFATALSYALPKTPIDYSLLSSDGSGVESFCRTLSEQSELVKQKLSTPNPVKPYILFIHGTAWSSKQWPEHYWHALAIALKKTPYQVYLPAGNTLDRERAERIAQDLDHVHVLPHCSLRELMCILKQAKAVVAVDTGLAHLTAAVGTPCVTLYGASSPALTGTRGKNQINLQADFHCSPCLNKTCRFRNEAFPPCYQSLSPSAVVSRLSLFNLT